MSGRRSISEDGEPKMMADPMKLKTAGRRASVLGGPGTEDGPIHVANGAPKTMSKPVQTGGRRSSVTMGSSSKISSAGELIGRRRESMSSGSDGGTPRVMQQPTTSGRRGSVTTGSSSSGSDGGLIESQAGAVEQAPKMSKPTKIGGRRASMTIGANMPAAAGGGIGNRCRSVENLTTLKAVAEESELEVSYGESPVTSPAQPVQSRIEPLSLRVQADAPSGR